MARSLLLCHHVVLLLNAALAAANVSELRGRVHALPEAVCGQRRARRPRLPELRRCEIQIDEERERGRGSEGIWFAIVTLQSSSMQSVWQSTHISCTLLTLSPPS